MISAGDSVLPDWAVGYLRKHPDRRYKIAYGGRGSGKSWAFARMLVMLAKAKPLRILCARELQNSIQDSVHQLIVDQIAALDCAHEFDVKENKIRSSAGAEFLFKGLRGMKNNAQAIKSLEGIDICWIEEGQTISADSFETLTPTIRKPGAEIWITFNPDQETDPVYRLAQNPPDGALVMKVNWDSNPWFDQTSLPSEREWLQRVDPDAYVHVWEGFCRQYTEAQILHGKYRIEAFEPSTSWSGPYLGADWGFAVDPTTLVKVWVNGRTLYVEQEAYGIGVEIDHTPRLFDTVKDSRKLLIRADNARPETISFMQRAGFWITGANKWPGSVEDGIEHLRSYESIVIHPRCKHTAEEVRLWSFKTDKLSGDIQRKPAPGHDHCWDAVRYALEPIIKQAYSGAISLSVAGI